MQDLNARASLMETLLGILEDSGDPDLVLYSKMMRQRKKATEMENALFRMVSEKPDAKKFEQLLDMMKNVECMYSDVINSWFEEDLKGEKHGTDCESEQL